MRTINVKASTEYSVKIGSRLLPDLGSEIASVVKGKNTVIVSDTNVWPIYGESTEYKLRNSGFTASHFIIPAGEQSKNADTYLQLLAFLADQQLDRNDCIIALGGGVVGDLAGFAASTYLRGIGYIQVPTSLLAMVDSSVGGKTAINLPEGKNLVGAFYQPKLVICDISLLNTLPHPEFIDGCAEVIKYGILYDQILFETLERDGLQFDREEVIAKCIEWKAKVVAQDEFDTTTRQMLNLGHTFGHAIEKESKYTISHGKAVAVGISLISRAGTKQGICRESDCGRIITLFQKFHLPTSTHFVPEALSKYTLADKKRQGDFITLTIPATIGCCKQIRYPIHDLEAFIKAGM
jgi:3-dehydroquinate synthase